MMFLRAFWSALVRTARLCGRVTLLLVWLLLLVLFYVQTRIATLETLELPDLAKRELQQDLMEKYSLRADFSRARFDFSGQVVIDDVRLGVSAFSDPLITIRRVELSLDRWLIFSLGRFDFNKNEPSLTGLPLRSLRELRVTGATLAARAADGSEAGSGAKLEVIDDLDFTLRPSRNGLTLPYLFARVGKVAVNANGELAFPSTSSSSPPTPAALLSAYLRIARQIHAASHAPSLPQSLQLNVVLRPSNESVAIADLRIAADNLPVVPAWPKMSSGPIVLTASLPLVSAAKVSVSIDGEVGSPVVVETVSADGLHFNLRAEWRPATVEFVPLRLDATLGAFNAREPALHLGPVAVAVVPKGERKLSVNVTTVLENEPLGIAAELNGQDGTMRLRTVLALDNRLVALAERLRPIDPGGPPPRPLKSVIDFNAPAVLEAEADFARKEGDLRLLRAEGWLDAGAARAEGVAFDAAHTHIIWDATTNRLSCTDAFLRIGESEARGSYVMDTTTLDYRFLLAGHLRPPAIDAWMEEWWPEFWRRNFSFPASPPYASLDLVGRWGTPLITVIQVAVDAPGAAVRGVPFDTVRARLFIRPGWTDGLEIETAQGTRGLHGAFSLTINRDDESWQRLEFSGTTNLSLALTGQLIGPEAAKIVEPFRFTEPPRLVLTGLLEEQSAAGWAHQSADLTIESTGEMFYSGFPLRDLVTRARVRDDKIELSSLSAEFAGGRAVGNATLWNDAQGRRRVRFDGRLSGAGLGEAIRTLENYSASRRGDAPATESKFQQQISTGTIDLTLSAEGEFARPPLLHGAGRVKVTGADFGKVNLLGLLSALLDRTLLNFTSPRFEALGGKPAEDRSVTDTAYTLDGDLLSFDDLWLTGPEAGLNAVGSYRLDTHTLDFRAKFRPFENGKTFAAKTFSLLTSPLSAALEVHLTGSLEKPDWIFINGPTNLLRSLIGGQNPIPSTSPAPTTEKR
jgi:hypothetical protein